MASKTLHLFTAQYPFGNKSETFLESEIPYLSDAFDQIYIYPSKTDATSREVPSNCAIISVEPKGRTRFAKLFFLLRYLSLTLVSFRSLIAEKGAKKVLKNAKVYLDFLEVQLDKYQQLKASQCFNQEAIYYDYWYTNSALALSFAKRKKLLSTFVCRAHGYDLYDERWPKSGIPFRFFVANECQQIFFISQMGLDYFNGVTGGKFLDKIFLSRLGVPKQEDHQGATISNDAYLIVSCSSILEFKNVHLIPELIGAFDKTISWVHFGDGPVREKVEQEARKLPKNIKAEFMGHQDNQKVLDFYRENSVDLLLSLSSSEGLPVSMMEAQSFGIPIVALPVGGISEIVINEQTGFHLPMPFSFETSRPILKSALEFEFKNDKIISFFESRFDASKNYATFVEQLQRL